MEKWDHHKRHNRENPSFSSTLLDSIYRSIEAEEEKPEDLLVFYREKGMMRKQKLSSSTPTGGNKNFLGDGNVGETKKPNFRRNSLTEFDRRRARSNYSSNSFSMFSSSSSSDSSSGYGFSSSESESWYKMQKPKPIRTSISSSIRPQSSSCEDPRTHSAQTQKPNNEKNGSSKAKSKALKILYGDLKKSKQPNSPGARLASFLHSLFNSSSGNTKKTKSSSSVLSNPHHHEPKVTTQQPSTCSSASSFSRSCLSKTPSSRSGAKRSVRFCPVSVIVDEDCRPCGQKNILLREDDDQEKKRNHSSSSSNNNNNEELRFHVMKESRRVEEFARELLLKTKMKKQKEFEMKYEDEEEEEEEDDDDGVSCSSSDLFELDNLSSIGIQRYREELPVYETTHFSTNRAIANGFIL